MRTTDNVQRRRAERGVALLIALFALLLISGVAISLIVMSGTESAIGANYRRSTQVFYASYSGLEEGRGRMRTGATPSLDPLTVRAGTVIMAVNQVRYILNPAPGEVVNPTNLAPDNPYRDTEYQTEFGIPVTNNVVCPSANCVNSISGGVVPGPVFKWVRITPKTKQAAGEDVDEAGTTAENTRPIFYDGQNQFLGPACPTPCVTPPPTGPNGQQYGQVIRVTALAVGPGGNRRLLEYDVARVFLNLSFSSALTLDGGPGVGFTLNGTGLNYGVTGIDNPASCGGTGPPQPCKPAVGTINPADNTNVTNTINAMNPPAKAGNWTGCGGTTPSVVNIGPAPGTGALPPNQTVASLTQLVQQIQSVATQTGPPLTNLGTQANPTIAYMNGDLTVGPVTGFGILVVNGNFTTNGAFTWNGVVIVVGTANVVLDGRATFNGAFLVANTLGGVPTYQVNGGGVGGITYSSGCINNAQAGVPYNVLSFREIPQ